MAVKVSSACSRGKEFAADTAKYAQKTALKRLVRSSNKFELTLAIADAFKGAWKPRWQRTTSGDEKTPRAGGNSEN